MHSCIFHFDLLTTQHQNNAFLNKIYFVQTLENNQRRKDINQGLTSNMSEIFAFFMRLIEMHVQEFREKTTAGDYAAAASHGQVVQVNKKQLRHKVQ